MYFILYVFLFFILYIIFYILYNIYIIYIIYFIFYIIFLFIIYHFVLHYIILIEDWNPNEPYLHALSEDIVFCPQNYILDPSVSQCRSHHRERWSLKGRIVIIDAPRQCGAGGP